MLNLITTRRTLIWMSNLVLTFAIVAGCGGKKAVTTTEKPAPELTATEPVAEPRPEEKAAPETAQKEMGPLHLESVHFDFDKYDLKPMTREVLAEHAQALKQRPEVSVVIEGHCDERGTVEYNLALGDRRAKAVKDYLVWLGADPSRLTTVSYGKERPVDPRHNEEAWAKNRRAEFVIKVQPTYSEAN
ncbi:MAG: peptidoglycan-associated lipoprotein Pal [candidate division KSB1 bacterium]|nr:peptidoglycan-associated lipoprotein Pal [candidate division KSB1 bacterium]